jgi:hypothetical protein
LVIDLLQKEVMSKNVLGCINTSEQESRANYIHRKECGELNTGDWIQVRVGQATKKRVDVPFITTPVQLKCYWWATWSP